MMGTDDIWALITGNFIGCLIVFFRMTGIFTFNPILSRANVPNQVKVAASMVLTVFTLSCFGGNTGFVYTSVPMLVFTLLKEALVGLVFGFFVNLIITAIILAGEIADNQIGFSMAKIMDPATGIQMPVMANLWFYMFVLYFFLVGGHLAYVRLFYISYQIVPIGFDVTVETLVTLRGMVSFTSVIFELAVKMAMPIVAAELISEIAIGIIMKAVPTIQVFVINIQFKIILGLIIATALAVPVADYVTMLLRVMQENLEGIMYGMG